MAKPPSLRQRILRTNAEFAEASPAKQRVMIAYDILSGLKCRKLRSEKGTLLFVRDNKGNMLPHDACSPDATRMPTCTVCARGALLVCALFRGSAVRNNDHYPIQDSALWDELTMVRIEAAFEGWHESYANGAYEVPTFTPDEAKWHDLCVQTKPDGVSVSDTLLTRIAENIISNDGDFDVTCGKWSISALKEQLNVTQG